MNKMIRGAACARRSDSSSDLTYTIGNGRETDTVLISPARLCFNVLDLIKQKLYNFARYDLYHRFFRFLDVHLRTIRGQRPETPDELTAGLTPKLRLLSPS